ncbi:hypothetical protein KFL_005900010 [Klebsormidium nitens]|uniref:Uncharacterized protein n=1 Tax=Klebsormidium nitens TaxID=105231 RepID=A0A1Y1IGN9_KLENI|nr:hypothetical protein KFL_005900010 [Klebsormidium nitens]|eukprot:GAQ90015.1 hypothetical protein KFL_005900010 [Klebsormidium nitens]
MYLIKGLRKLLQRRDDSASGIDPKLLKEVKRLSKDKRAVCERQKIIRFYELIEDLAYLDKDTAFPIYLDWCMLDPEIRAQRLTLPIDADLRASFNREVEWLKPQNEGKPSNQRHLTLTPALVIFYNRC